MKTIQSILKKKTTGGQVGQAKELDEKTLARVFFEAAKGEISNLEDADIRETKLKSKTLYIKTAHPVVSSELVLRRKKILKEVNNIAGSGAVENFFVSS
jgi:TFIIF-interacting CTD phosphatase-like protein